MSIYMNVHMFKIIRMPMKLGVHMYATHANCQTLQPCVFFKNASSRDRAKSWFFVTFNITIYF